jgi:hypothetical protein
VPVIRGEGWPVHAGIVPATDPKTVTAEIG